MSSILFRACVVPFSFSSVLFLHTQMTDNKNNNSVQEWAAIKLIGCNSVQQIVFIEWEGDYEPTWEPVANCNYELLRTLPRHRLKALMDRCDDVDVMQNLINCYNSKPAFLSAPPASNKRNQLSGKQEAKDDDAMDVVKEEKKAPRSRHYRRFVTTPQFTAFNHCETVRKIASYKLGQFSGVSFRVSFDTQTYDYVICREGELKHIIDLANTYRTMFRADPADPRLLDHYNRKCKVLFDKV